MITQSNRLVQEIAAEHESLGENLQELESRVRAVADWRGHVQRRPIAMLGLALGGGILLSALMGSPRRRRSKVVESSVAEDDRPTQRIRAPVDETWDRFRGALVAAATARVAAYIEDSLPGFREEFER
jgi:hypothetical protein